ncbi:MAG: nucleotidyltransferase family protein [Terracidiphilus sp.]
MKVLDRDTGNLLRAVVQPHSATGGKTVAKLATQISCWDVAIEAARHHGILPMLYAALAANRAAIPPKALELLRSEFERNAFHCFANASELLQVLSAFELAGIPAMPFKGVVLGASAYGDMTARTAGDLDVLIYYRDLLPATRILKDRGYEVITKVREDGSPVAENYFEYHFERAADGMVLELRWQLELTQPRYKYNLGMDWVWNARRTARLAGAEVPHFDAVSELLMLCMHGSKHAWSRLIWICDVAKMLASEPELDWELARREANRVGLWRCLALGVMLAQRVAGAEVPTAVSRRFDRDRTARKLAEFLDENVVVAPGSMPVGRIPYNIQLLGFRDRAGVILSPEFLRPNEQDRAVVKLPKALESLYYVIRPFRFLIDRSAR